ncbi:hypothetical protein EN837_28975, partial [bacterium M00.F.Ca.ET.194.01.1.1]
NPDTQDGVTIIIGPGTEIIAGEGKILTAGGFDAHIHFICPQQIEEALMSAFAIARTSDAPGRATSGVVLRVQACRYPSLADRLWQSIAPPPPYAAP